MQIDISGPERLLEDLRLYLGDLLEQKGYSKGPKLLSMGAGMMVDYLKDDIIVSIEISEEAEGQECRLHVECEQDIPGFDEIWDTALVNYGKDIIVRLRSYAKDKKKVEQEL